MYRFFAISSNYIAYFFGIVHCHYIAVRTKVYEYSMLYYLCIALRCSCKLYKFTALEKSHLIYFSLSITFTRSNTCSYIESTSYITGLIFDSFGIFSDHCPYSVWELHIDRQLLQEQYTTATKTHNISSVFATRYCRYKKQRIIDINFTILSS